MGITLRRNREKRERKESKRGLKNILKFLKGNKNREKFKKYVAEQEEIHTIVHNVKVKKQSQKLKEINDLKGQLDTNTNEQYQEKPKNVVNSMQSLFHVLSEFPEQKIKLIQRQVKDTKNTLMKEYETSHRKVNKKIFKDRLQDIGMKYLFVAELLQMVLGDKQFLKEHNIQLGENIVFFTEHLKGFKGRLQNIENYLPDLFTDFFAKFENDFEKWDKVNITPELLKSMTFNWNNKSEQLVERKELEKLLGSNLT